MAGPALSQTLDDFLFDAFCDRPDMDKLISTCYTPALAEKSIFADNVPAYTAASRGEFYGLAANAGKKMLTIVSSGDAESISVSCTLPADNANPKIKVNGKL